MSKSFVGLKAKAGPFNFLHGNGVYWKTNFCGIYFLNKFQKRGKPYSILSNPMTWYKACYTLHSMCYTPNKTNLITCSPHKRASRIINETSPSLRASQKAHRETPPELWVTLCVIESLKFFNPPSPDVPDQILLEYPYVEFLEVISCSSRSACHKKYKIENFVKTLLFIDEARL